MNIIKILRFKDINRQEQPLYTLTLFVTVPIGLLVSSAIGIYMRTFINSIKEGFVFDRIIPSRKILQFKYLHPSGLYCRCLLDGKNTDFGNKLVFYTSNADLLKELETRILNKETNGNDTYDENIDE